MVGQRDLEESAARVRFEAEQIKIKSEKKRRRQLTVGRWVADNIVAIGALIVAIIALVRTF